MARPLYLQAPYVVVFLAASLLLASREVLVRRYLRVDPETAVDAGSFRVLWSVTAVGTAVALVAPLWGLGVVPDPALAFWLGLATMLAGFLLRLSAVATLGELFSHRVALKPGHEVVDSGPYRWVRHPAYTGAVVTYLGIGLACGSWLSVAAASGAALVGYGYRVRVEEPILRRELPGYDAYADRTPYRLVPLVW